jgi:hypothetical protein
MSALTVGTDAIIEDKTHCLLMQAGATLQDRGLTVMLSRGEYSN